MGLIHKIKRTNLLVLIMVLFQGFDLVFKSIRERFFEFFQFGQGRLVQLGRGDSHRKKERKERKELGAEELHGGSIVLLFVLVLLFWIER